MKINKVILETSSIRQLKEFYSSVLDVPIFNLHEDSFTLLFGVTHLEFQETSHHKNPFYHFALNIPSNKIEEACKWLRSKVELIWLEDYQSYIADFSNWNAKSVYFFDPVGNIVELISRFDLNDHSVTAFDANQIRNVSEIGLVYPTDSFDHDVEKLMTRFNLSYFEKQPPLPYFRAIGDNEGLFVTVPENRNWYPTSNFSAKTFPMEINFHSYGAEFFLKV